MRAGGSGDGGGTIGIGKGRIASERDMRSKEVPGLPRPPRFAAVSLTVRDGSGFTYRDAMTVLRREVKLSVLDITELRLRKAITEALLFEIPGQEGAEIGVGTSMKYLGLTLDSHWTFGAHFERLTSSVEATGRASECAGCTSAW